MKIEICFTNQKMKMEVFKWVDLKKGPDTDRICIYWLRKIDSGFCFQNQENRTLNEIFFLKMKKEKKKLRHHRDSNPRRLDCQESTLQVRPLTPCYREATFKYQYNFISPLSLGARSRYLGQWRSLRISIISN